MKLVALSCPECGGDLEIPTELSSVHCMFCGTKFVVPSHRPHSKTTDTFAELSVTALKAKNYRDALEYSSEILEMDSSNVKAWIDKAFSCFMVTNSISVYDESVAYLKKAYALEPKHPEIKKTLDKIIKMQANWLNSRGLKLSKRAIKYYESRSGTISSISLEGFAYKAAAVADARSGTADDFLQAMKYFILAANFEPTNLTILGNILQLKSETSWIEWEKIDGVVTRINMLDIIHKRNNAVARLLNFEKKLTTAKEKLVKVEKKEGFLAGIKTKNLKLDIDYISKEISELEVLTKIKFPEFAQSLD